MDAHSTQQQDSATMASSQPQVQYTAPAAAMFQPSDHLASFAAVPHPAMGAGNEHIQHPQMQMFWNAQMLEIEQVTDFRTHQLPLARIKKIMKADEDVRMIAAEAPVLFAKACEMFILELTLRSWIHTGENKRRTLQKNDIAAAVTKTDIFDFLVDIVPRDELKDEGLGIPRAGLPVGATADALPYGGMFYMAQQPHQASGAIPVIPQTPTAMMASPGIIVGRPLGPINPAVYRTHAVAYVPQQTAWQRCTTDAQTEAPKSRS